MIFAIDCVKMTEHTVEESQSFLPEVFYQFLRHLMLMQFQKFRSLIQNLINSISVIRSLPKGKHILDMQRETNIERFGKELSPSTSPSISRHRLVPDKLAHHDL